MRYPASEKLEIIRGYTERLLRALRGAACPKLQDKGTDRHQHAFERQESLD